MKKLERARLYYLSSPQLTDDTIRRFLEDNKATTLHGGKAVNAFLPDYLDKPTEDWDVIVPNNPKAVAGQLEHLLDTRYEGNFFKVLPSRHTGTYRIISIVTQRPIADVTLAEGPVPTKILDGINVATLDFHVKCLKDALADPRKKFRHRKDRETLQRINIHKTEQKELPTDLPGLST
ncbi:MAG: hypothetical protein D4S01_02570 [Dehalococcoidia bacterium]|nr:MAG: hypothetical protein D4S01_02570 [Dehalococcoidia bacterium]